MIGLRFKTVHTCPSKEWHLDKAKYHLLKRNGYSVLVNSGVEDELDEAECMRCTMLHDNWFRIHSAEYVCLSLYEDLAKQVKDA